MNTLDQDLEIAFGDPQCYKIPSGIIRYDYSRSHYWWLRIRRDGARFEERYFDGASGGIENGLKMAIKFRNELLANFPITLPTKKVRQLQNSHEKRVKRTKDVDGDKIYYYWQAKWYDDDFNVIEKNFSVIRYGDDKAKVLALDEAKVNHNYKTRPGAIVDVQLIEKWRPIIRKDIEILSKINCDPYKKESNGKDILENSDPFGHEGGKKFIFHKVIERDKSLRNKKIQHFLSVHDNLHCEICNIQLRKIYNFIPHDIIEVHHIVPLSKLTESQVISFSDLIVICPNCHTAIHQGDAMANLIE